MTTWLNRLKQLVGLGETPQPIDAVADKRKRIRSATKKTPAKAQSPDQPAETKKPRKASKRIERETGYILIVGLDFGTAYTKCIVRDAMVRDPGKAYPIAFNLRGGRSYLFPSVVVRSQAKLLTARETEISSHDEVIDYLKMRLVAEVEGKRASSWRMADGGTPMQTIVAWFLAQVLAEVGRECQSRWADFGQHPDDTFYVNCCVPIAYADGSHVDATLHNALCAARATVGSMGIEAPTLTQIEVTLGDPARLASARDYCYTYPETSANLQSYLKSRARQPGLYLFLDVGAGTVDLSFFQLMSDAGDDAPLRYYHASVLDAGSSRLELKTVKIAPSLTLSEVIDFKEGRNRRPSEELIRAFEKACSEIHNEVGKGVGAGVVVTESKLHPDRQVQLRQMRSVQLMFAGGGFSPNPYELAARFFQKARKWDRHAPMHPLPQPDDIEWSQTADPIPFSRLSVAYGLSFARYELDGQRFPGETKVNPNAQPRHRRPEIVAPTKDEV